MKTLFQVIMFATLFTSCQDFNAEASALEYNDKTCLQDVNHPNKYSISVKLKTDEDTGLTTSIQPMTLFTENNYCLDSLSWQDESYDFPSSKDDIGTELKCYKNLKSDNHFYLLNEWINLETGMIIGLKYILEFDSESACKSHL